MTKVVKDSTKIDSDAGTALCPQPGNKRKKLTRAALTLREKAVVKNFCQQKLNDCKARGESVPSQEILRREVAAQFGWTCGRSTLSKILSMDWKLLRGSHEGGDAPRNPDMKRRRRPLFPAFEADLVKFILAQVKEESDKGSVSKTTSGIGVNAGRGQGRRLTQALILKEAQRLKKVHGVSDAMLALSDGWLAQFKHRHCIRLRKPAGTSNNCLLPLHHQLGLGAWENAESRSGDAWSSSLIASNVSDMQDVSEQAVPHQPCADHAAESVGSTANSLPTSIQQAGNDEMTGNTAQRTVLKSMKQCSVRWHLGKTDKPSRISTILLEQIPESIRELACSCQGSATYNELFRGIAGLRVAVVGFGSVVEAFLTAALVGTYGFVTCVEASYANVDLAKQVAENFCLVTLGLPAVNIEFVVDECGSMAQSSSSCAVGDELKHLQGQVDLVLCNCSIQSLKFPADKNVILEMAFSLLKVGGELRVAEFVCSRRLSASDFAKACSTVENETVIYGTTSADVLSRLSEQTLLLRAPYMGDLRRLFQALGGDVEVRFVSCKKAEAAEIDVAFASLFPTLAAANDVSFHRVTFHVFRLLNVEDSREDYGETAEFYGYHRYKRGDGEDLLMSFQLDDDFDFQRGVRTHIDGNTAQILQTSWMRPYFFVHGDRSSHRGPFVASKYATKCPSPVLPIPAIASVFNNTMHTSKATEAAVADQRTTV